MRRAWTSALAALPPLRDRTVLDLACGPGEQAEALAERGARVVGVDMSEPALERARARGIPGASFHAFDLRRELDLDVRADGIWCSYGAAYLVDLGRALASWRRHLRPGGWIALTEIDDLFGHEPLSAASRSMLEDYAEEALAAKRYDFHMGVKLATHLERAGYAVASSVILADDELAFDGAASAEALAAWRARLERMPLLQAFCGATFPAIRDELLDCLAHPDHRARATVRSCLATAP